MRHVEEKRWSKEEKRRLLHWRGAFVRGYRTCGSLKRQELTDCIQSRRRFSSSRQSAAVRSSRAKRTEKRPIATPSVAAIPHLDPPSYRSHILSSLQSLYFRPSRLPGSLFSESGKGMGTAFLRFHIISRKMPYQAMYKLYHKSYNLPVEAMCFPSRPSHSQAISLSKATVLQPLSS